MAVLKQYFGMLFLFVSFERVLTIIVQLFGTTIYYNLCEFLKQTDQVWPKPFYNAQSKRKEDKADRKRGGKTTSGNGLAWSSPSPRGPWRKEKDGGNWLRNHL